MSEKTGIKICAGDSKTSADVLKFMREVLQNPSADDVKIQMVRTLGELYTIDSLTISQCDIKQ